MKKLFFAFSLLFGAAVAVNAQDSTSTQDPSNQFRTDTTATEPMDTTANEAEQPVETDTTSQDQSSIDQPSPANEEPAVSSNSDSSTPPATQDQPAEGDQDEDADRVEITVAELPATVSTQLESSDYSGWTVDKVYKKEKDGQVFYSVKLKQGSEMKKVKFDAQGNVVEEKEKDKDSKKHDQ
jgi:hypothetical protein